MQTLYACACDIKSNVGFFPLIIIIIIIILILSSLLRVVKVVSENKAVTRGPRRRRRRRPGTTKKKEKKNWSSSSEVSPKKNEKEKRFLDMKKTQSFDMRGHTPSKKKKTQARTWRLHLHLFRGDFLLFHLGTREKRDAKRREDVGGSRLPPKKVQTIHKKKSNHLSVNPRATERRRHFGGQKTTTGEREKRRRRCGVARRTTEPRGP